MARRGTGHILLGWVLSLLLLTIALACTTKTENSEIWYLANIREIRTINPVTLQQRVIIPRKGHMILENPGERVVVERAIRRDRPARKEERATINQERR